MIGNPKDDFDRFAESSEKTHKNRPIASYAFCSVLIRPQYASSSLVATSGRERRCVLNPALISRGNSPGAGRNLRPYLRKRTIAATTNVAAITSPTRPISSQGM